MERHAEKEIRIVVGAGSFINNPGWVHLQEEELNLLEKEDWTKRFKRGTITAILAEHVWEHLNYQEGAIAAQNCHHFLKQGGYIRCAVPDGYFPDRDYQKLVQVGGPGPVDHPAATHKIIYNYVTLTKMFEQSGFKVRLLEYFDPFGNFHYNEWDASKGKIYRSLHFDHRNQGGEIKFTSLIVDAIKLS